MDHIEYLKTKYKHAVTPTEYTLDEFLGKIKEKIDIEPISTDLLSPIYFQITKENVCHCILNARQQINTREVNFIAFEVIRNEKSEEYYCDDMTEVLMDETAQNSIIILIERKLNFLTSNSAKLNLELNILRGVSQYDYDHETILFISYLATLDLYDEQYGYM